jgi:hypothetical protein
MLDVMRRVAVVAQTFFPLREKRRKNPKQSHSRESAPSESPFEPPSSRVILGSSLERQPGAKSPSRSSAEA